MELCEFIILSCSKALPNLLNLLASRFLKYSTLNYRVIKIIDEYIQMSVSGSQLNFMLKKKKQLKQS